MKPRHEHRAPMRLDSPALILFLITAGCCDMDRDCGGNTCEGVSGPEMEATESWEGVTPLDGVAILDGLAGEWSIIDNITNDIEHVVVLESRAEFAGPAHVWEFSRALTGETCRAPHLEVPVRLELSSPDGRWAFAGEVRNRNEVDGRWTIHSVDRGLEAVSYDADFLSSETDSTCNDIRLSIDLAHSQDGDTFVESAKLKAWCPDGSVQELYGSKWTGEPDDGESESGDG